MSLQCQGDEGLPVGLAAGKRGQVLDRSEGARPRSDAESFCRQVTECLGINVRAADWLQRILFNRVKASWDSEGIGPPE